MDLFLTNFKISFNAVASVFLIVAIGYAVRRVLKLEKPVVKKFNTVVYFSLLPLMLFTNIYTSNFVGAVRGKFVLFVMVMLVIVIGAAWVLTCMIEKAPSKRGTMIQACFRSNYLILGLPIVQELFPGADLSIVAVMIAILVTSFNICSIIAFEVNSESRTSVKKVLVDLIKNPLIIATIIAFALKLCHLQLPHFMETSVLQLGTSASPIALLILGMEFEFKTLGQDKRDLIFTVIYRLFIAPAIVLTAAYLCGISGLEFGVLIAVFGSSTAVASFSVAVEMGGDADLAANCVAVTTAFSIFSLFIWIFLAKTLGAI